MTRRPIEFCCIISRNLEGERQLKEFLCQIHEFSEIKRVWGGILRVVALVDNAPSIILSHPKMSSSSPTTPWKVFGDFGSVK